MEFIGIDDIADKLVVNNISFVKRDNADSLEFYRHSK